MLRRHLQMAVSFVLASGLTACSGAGGSLPTTGAGSALTASNPSTNNAVTLTSSVVRTQGSGTTYSYTAPWGGFGAPGYIFTLPQSPCSYIPATRASGFAWPAFLNTLKQGTIVTLSGVPSYANSWSQTNNCPTGGIAVSSIVVGKVGSAPSPTPVPTVTPVQTNAAGIAIAVGGKATGTWLGDADVSGGTPWSTTTAVVTSRVTNPAPVSVYEANRYGRQLTAVMPNLTPSTAYTVRLHFAETYWSATGQRVFNTTINGAAALTNFDIFKAAGAKNTAVIEQFAATADASGKITIAFAATKDNAEVSGIEIVRGTATPTPVPTVAPTPVPTAAPTPVSTPAPGGWKNVFPAFAGNKLLPANPVIHPQSQAMIDLLYNNTNGHNLSGPTLADAQSSYYDAKSSDPLHTIHCTYKWGPSPTKLCAMEGKQIHIPAGAVPGANSDQHTSILAPDGCTLDDFWLMQKDMSQSTLTAAFGAEYNECTGDGFVQSATGATQGGGSNRLGRTTLAELQTGVIHHAVLVATSCNPIIYSVGQSRSVLTPTPATPGSPNSCVAGDTGVSMPYGAYLWSDVAPANLPASLDKATRMICTALNEYGGVNDATTGPWNGISVNAMWNTTGNPGYAAWFTANTTNNATHPSSCFPNGDWRHHLHVLAF